MTKGFRAHQYKVRHDFADKTGMGADGLAEGTHPGDKIRDRTTLPLGQGAGLRDVAASGPNPCRRDSSLPPPSSKSGGRRTSC